MPDHDRIYAEEASKYHEMISKQPLLGECIEGIRSYSGLDIADLGAGSGRLTTVLAKKAKSIVALDASEEMLRITADRLRQDRLSNGSTKVADLRKLPLEDHSVDLVVAGWSICYVASSNVQDWQTNLNSVVREMKRVLRSGGTAIIFETMGTGVSTPEPPDFLTAYYSKLTQEYGFSHKWIRTDYSFENITQAVELSRFFFGEDLANRVLEHNLLQLPECAGVWWLHLD